MGYKLPKPQGTKEEIEREMNFRKEHGVFKWGFVKSMMFDKKLKLSNSSADGTYGFQIEYPILASLGYLLSRRDIDFSILGQKTTMLWTISPKGSFLDSDKKRNPRFEELAFKDDFEENIRYNMVYCDDYEEQLPKVASSTLQEFEVLCEISADEKIQFLIADFFKKVTIKSKRETIYKRITGIEINPRDKTKTHTIRKIGERRILEMIVEADKTHHLFD
jgi:hypothetical protein